MGAVTCIKCNRIMRRVKSTHNYASICPECAGKVSSTLPAEQRLAMAKVGLDALIDEATVYQYQRSAGDLKGRLKKYYHSDTQTLKEITEENTTDK